MVDDFESSDILGSSSPVGPGRLPQSSTFSSFFKLCVLGACSLVVFLAVRNGHAVFLRWKERHYKLSMRRRYGIPDHDQRPFNVAYAAARLAQEDGRNKQDRTPFLTGGGLNGGQARHEQGGIRLRLNGTGQAGSSASRTPDLRVNVRESLSTGRPSLQQRQPAFPGAIDDITTSFDVSQNNIPARTTDSFPSKYPQDLYCGLIDSHKTSRDISEDEGQDHDLPEPSVLKSKRLADSGDDGDLESTQGRRHDKRRRKVSNHHASPTQDDEDVEMADEVKEMKASRRGKKRDRAEAGSTFGGDDELLMDELDEDRAHRHRRRRHRKSSTSNRGQKRGRDAELTSEEDDDVRPIAGKSSRRRQDTSLSMDSDISMDDTYISKDPLCKGRRIGEEWEAHGTQFKVGPDGQRLRKVLVKEDRPKFSMPEDSAHPDRGVSITAIVERWYTEEEYKGARERQELAWQVPSKPAPEPVTPETDSLMRSGKELLWSSTSPPTSPAPRRSLGLSLATNIGLPASPLIQSQSGSFRRVTALYSSNIKPPEMSPKLRATKSYSKWEKQEIEAQAMARLRRRNEEEQVKKAAEEKQKTLPMPAPAAPVAPQSSPAPKTPFSFAKPEDKPASTNNAPTPSAASTLLALGKETKSNPSVPSSVSSAPPAFRLPTPPSTASKQADKPKPPHTQPPPAPATFSFAAPTTQSTSTPVTNTSASQGPSSAGIPNFFGSRGASPATKAEGTSTPAAQSREAKETKSLFSFAPLPAAGFGSTTSPSFSFSTDTSKSGASQPEPAKVTNTPNGVSSIDTFGQLSTPASAMGGDVSSTKPKFSFNVGGKAPLNTSPAPFASEPAKAPSFNFNATASSGTSAASSQPSTNPAPNADTSAANLTSSQNNITKPTFSFPTSGNPFGVNPASTGSSFVSTPASNSSAFGTTSSPTPAMTGVVFGTTPNGDSSKTTSAPTLTTNGSAFRGFGSSATSVPKAEDKPSEAGKTIFGAASTTTSAPKSAFGQSAFGQTSTSGMATASPFGGPATSSTPFATKSNSSFGPSSQPGQTLGATPMSAFGTSNNSSTPLATANGAQPSSGFSFNFGKKGPESAMASTPNGAAAPQGTTPLTFGPQTNIQPAAFGFGFPAQKSGSAFTFGPSSEQDKK